MPKEGYLTASQFAAAVGLNPYLSRAALYRQLRGLEPRFAGNAYTEHGNRTEPTALAIYEARTGLLVDGRQSWFEKRHYGTHLDGITFTESGELRLVEVKCPISGLYESVPPYYLPQVLGQQWLADAQQTDFVAYHEGELAVWQIHFSELWWEWLEEQLDKFWEDTMAGREPPRRKPQPPDHMIQIERVI